MEKNAERTNVNEKQAVSKQSIWKVVQIFLLYFTVTAITAFITKLLFDVNVKPDVYLMRIITVFIPTAVTILVFRKENLFECFKPGMKHFSYGVFCVGGFITIVEIIFFIAIFSFLLLQPKYNLKLSGDWRNITMPESFVNILLYILYCIIDSFSCIFIFCGVILRKLMKKWGSTPKGVAKVLLVTGLLYGIYQSFFLLYGVEPSAVLQSGLVGIAIIIYFSAVYLRSESLPAALLIFTVFNIIADFNISMLVSELNIVTSMKAFDVKCLITILIYSILAMILLRDTKITDVLYIQQEEEGD